uniref:interferon-induced very large GTPase 1-like n=1 Tax=Epinephelus lanceolatus TaxID=310571 RepID=UPI0014452369|nr:interferon-induced very large GTPase 1-like [Epinephelus lanceolatus]
MWNRMVKELSFSKQKPADVFASVYHYLRENLRRKGSHVCQLLSKKTLSECGLVPFRYTAEGFFNQLKHIITKFFNTEDHIKSVQQMADSIIADCKQYVTGKVVSKSNYHDTYIQEILHMIDEKLQNNKEVKTDVEFEVSLKQHICGDAARQFQKMHEDFIYENDPYRCLNENKAKFRADFKDVFHNQDQCQKKAEEFTNRCLKPAVEDFVKRSLGPDIFGEMMTSQQFRTRIYLQYTILLDLLTTNDFKSYLSYTGSYEYYVKKWILDQIVERFSKGSIMFELEDKHVQSSIRNITNAIIKAKTKKSCNLRTFVEDVCQELGVKLVISQDALGAFMILNNTNPEQFAHWLTDCLKDMAEALTEKFKETNVQTKLKQLHVNPQNELFTKLIGCGKQCPFCKAPCEAGGKDHTEHWTSLHRPEGLGRYRWDRTKELVTDVCTSLVISDNRFRCSATNGEWHSYKLYKEIFPDWKIVPDVSLQASDYWKYVMTKFNKEFAERYEAKPADIPDTWRDIKYEQAEKSLKESFNIK